MLTALCEEARAEARELASRLDAKLARIAEEATNENKQLREEIKHLQSENKALKIALGKLKSARDRDKMAVKAWQQQLSEHEQGDENLEQQNINEEPNSALAVLASSPPQSPLPPSSQSAQGSPRSIAAMESRDWHPEDFVLNPDHLYSMEAQDTPAGFWDVDFPTSSQIQRQKAAAQEQIRQTGLKRLHEALNNGRYTFKDPKLRKRWSRQP